MGMILCYQDVKIQYSKLTYLLLLAEVVDHIFYDFVPFRYRLQTVRSLAGVSLMLRLLWACLRWDDMAVKPSAAVGTTRKGEKYCILDLHMYWSLTSSGHLLFVPF